jgi:hypothetical protein
MHESTPDVEVDLDFYYATLGYHFNDELFVYGSYWISKAHIEFLTPGDEYANDEKISVPTVGISYDLNYRIRLKAQYAHVTEDDELVLGLQDFTETHHEFNLWALAISVFF